ncbi:hypothetical protein CC78DRAFT_582542 [Lojkania enalia]|uniref:Uncharacterized protein n=1 Tax=Lojkania enalia TaxID=147567 RepID=A0A9P4K6C8_9PLEO|nr:hypothetical protein CC78DRAFT_582542 [Didymosphaeria enalia]
MSSTQLFGVACWPGSEHQVLVTYFRLGFQGFETGFHLGLVVARMSRRRRG